MEKKTDNYTNIIFIVFTIIGLIAFNLKKYEIYSDKIVVSYLGLKTNYILTDGRVITLPIKYFHIRLPFTIIPRILYFKNIKRIEYTLSKPSFQIGARGRFYLQVYMKNRKNFGLVFSNREQAYAFLSIIKRKTEYKCITNKK